MTVKRVLKMGEPLLLEKAQPVTDITSEEITRLIDDMWDTSRAHKGVGLAAPQIGISLQVVIFGCKSNPRYPKAGVVPDSVLINPVITPTSDEQEDGWEGCLSVPDWRGLVPRYTSIMYRGYNAKGELMEGLAEGFHARILQHECDHLAGILYPMRMKNMAMFGFHDALFESGRLS